MARERRSRSSQTEEKFSARSGENQCVFRGGWVLLGWEMRFETVLLLMRELLPSSGTLGGDFREDEHGHEHEHEQEHAEINPERIASSSPGFPEPWDPAVPTRSTL